MKTRTLKELYEILLNYSVNNGICHNIDDIYAISRISYKEYELLKRDFNKRKPFIFSKFFWHKSFQKFSHGYSYWWNGKESNEQRKLFIQHIINTL